MSCLKFGSIPSYCFQRPGIMPSLPATAKTTASAHLSPGNARKSTIKGRRLTCWTRRRSSHMAYSGKQG